MGRSITTRRGPLPRPEVRADDRTLTRFAGLVPVLSFMTERLELPQRLALVVGDTGRRRRYAVHHVLFAFLAASLAGFEKLTHLEFLRGDAVVEKFLRLPGWPVRKVFSKALAGLSAEAIGRLEDLVASTGLWTLQDDAVVIDVDSTVLVSFGHHEGAVHGYCGKGRNRRRHHPLVASVAAARAVVHAVYGDGSKETAQALIDFILAAIARVKNARPNAVVTLRADSGFAMRAVLDALLAHAIPFTMSYPMHPNVKLMLVKAQWKPLQDEEDIQTASIAGDLVGLDPRLRIAAVRRRVHDPSQPPQGKAIDWSPNWRYQAVVTNLEWDAADTWRFYNGRADCERVFKVAKHALGLSWLVGHDYTANAAAFLLRLLAYNADIHFHEDAKARAEEAGHPVLDVGLQARQVRFYNGAGRLLRIANRWVLRLSDNRRIEQQWRFYAPRLFSG